MTGRNGIMEMAGRHRVSKSGEAPPRKAMLLDLGLEEYARAYSLQLRLNLLRQIGEIPDTVVFVEHPPCLTMGRASHRENVLAAPEELQARGIAVHATDRGGDVTYHGPGQLVLYAIIHLDGYGRDVHAHARRLEQVLIDAVASFGLEATRKKGYPGVWTAEGKIGAIGLSVKRWVTLHGVALNVSPDMSHFSLIVPCGIRDRGVTSLADVLGYSVGIAPAKVALRESFERVFGVYLADNTAETSSSSRCRPRRTISSEPADLNGRGWPRATARDRIQSHKGNASALGSATDRCSGPSD
jgi:lipoyl(octanoyl) transferase